MGRLDTDYDKTPSAAEKVLRQRSNMSLEHVFTLLSLILPGEPLQVAHHGLLTNDASLRGTALDYLDNVLPSEIRDALWPYLEPAAHEPLATASAEEVVGRLLASHKSIQLHFGRAAQADARGRSASYVRCFRERTCDF